MKCHTNDNQPRNKPKNGKIYWELNWLDQRDPRLIKFIKDEILIPPPSNKKLNLWNEFDDKKPWKHQGQNGEALVVEYFYYLNQIDKKSSE